MRLRTLGLIILLAAVGASTAVAQTLNPTAADFTASTDHSTNAADGTPIVQSYRIDFFASGSSAVVASTSLGKPTPLSDGTIHVDLAAALLGWPVFGTVYTAKVSAVGPGGSTASTVSNTFTFAAPCSFSVSPASGASSSAGGSVTFNVTAGIGCGWTATETATWLAITSGASGSGSGTVAISVDANTSTSSRASTITVAGQSVTITQAGITCTYGASPTSFSQAAAAGSSTTSVTAPSGCTWTAVANQSWLSVTSGASGSGNGSVGFAIAANTTITARTGTLTVAGQTMTISQQSIPCTYSASPTTVSPSAASTALTASITSPSGCTWTATSNSSWLTVASGSASGSGNGTVDYTVAANASTSARSGTLTIAGQTITVNQVGGTVPAAPAGLHITQ